MGAARAHLRRYLPALTQPNVKVITDAVREVRGGPSRRRRRVHPVDTIVLATGFQVTERPSPRTCAGPRRRRTLADVWQVQPGGHLGTTVAGFPNYFMLSGPNTARAQLDDPHDRGAVEHLLGALRHMRSHTRRAIGPPLPRRSLRGSCNDRMRGTVWTSGGCSSWYLDRTGRNSTLWPGATLSFRRRVERFDPREYREEALRDAGALEMRGDERRAG